MGKSKKNLDGHHDKKTRRVLVTRNGAYRVCGSLPLNEEIMVSDSGGYPVKWSKGRSYPDREEYDLCRCGQSRNKPHCDKTHAKISFDGTETASRRKYLEQAKRISGPDLVLTDAQELCASARFCDRAGGVWRLTRDSNNTKSKEIAIQEACDCPSGRLVVWDKNGQPIEPRLEQSISLIEDPEERVGGPIWVKGGIPVVSSDGTEYEIRNRVTLCCCGRSGNKPFCDSSHM